MVSNQQSQKVIKQTSLLLFHSKNCKDTHISGVSLQGAQGVPYSHILRSCRTNLKIFLSRGRNSSPCIALVFKFACRIQRSSG